MAKKKLGIALGAGGAWTIACLGVLKVLQENEIKIDYLSGSSMGALIGAAYASNLAGDQTLHEVEKMIAALKLRKAISFSIHNSFGLFSSEKIGREFEKLAGELNFEDLYIPMSVVATDFQTGEEVIFTKGSIAPALSASAAFAILFSPYKYQGKLLTDGGLSQPIPVKAVKDLGADITIGIDITSKRHTKRAQEVQESWHHKLTRFIPPLHYISHRNITGGIGQTVDLLFSNLNRKNMELDPPDFLLIPEVTHMDQFGFHLASEFIKEGERVAREILPELKKRLA